MLTMRTTVRLPGDLLRRAKVHAAARGRTLTDVMAEALRLVLDRKEQRPAPRRIVLPTSGGGGLRPGVNINDTSQLLDIMDGIVDPRRR